MSWAEADIETWETPCEECGSLRVVEIECNTDYPEAAEHAYWVCADCGEQR